MSWDEAPPRRWRERCLALGVHRTTVTSTMIVHGDGYENVLSCNVHGYEQAHGHVLSCTVTIT